MSCFIVKKIQAISGKVDVSPVGYIDASDESSFISIHAHPFTDWVIANPGSPQVDYFVSNDPCYVLDTSDGTNTEGLFLITDLNNPEGV